MRRRRGGYRLATTVNGHGTGEHPDRIVVDDPQDPAGVESEAERQSLLEWWDLTMSTWTAVSRGRWACVIIMQRLSVDDLLGPRPQGAGVGTYLPTDCTMQPDRMPDTASWNGRTTRGRPRARLLAPVQFPEEKPRPRSSAKLTAYGVAGQFQQRPTPSRRSPVQAATGGRESGRYELQNGEAIICQGKPGVIPLNSLATFIIVDGGSMLRRRPPIRPRCWCSAWPTTAMSSCCTAQRQRLELEDVVPILDDLCLAWHPEWVGIEANGFQKWFVKVAR